MLELSLIEIIFFGSIGFCAGLIDSIAGGGGLITVPALLSAGLPPVVALGTNKLQSSFGSFAATWHYRKASLVQLRDVWRGVFFTALGAMSGTLLVQHIDNSILKHIIPFCLLVLFVYFLFSPKIGNKDKKQHLSQNMFYILCGLGIGFFDGFFGPGTGSFWALAFVTLLGYNLKKATAHTKVMNFTSNIVALIIFAIPGNINFLIGILMGLGQLLGASIGSRLVIVKGTRFVRLIFICVVGATLIKMYWNIYD